METAIFILTVLIALSVGGYVYTSPQDAILLQKKFYALINWRMEPISMSKEIRNTRLMGLFLIIFTLMSCIYYWLRY